MKCTSKAEYGVAAHWRYKEAGKQGYAGTVSAKEEYDRRIAWARQLIAWKEDALGSTQRARARRSNLCVDTLGSSRALYSKALPRLILPTPFTPTWVTIAEALGLMVRWCPWTRN
jgi:uncharacterized lipoprotein